MTRPGQIPERPAVAAKTAVWIVAGGVLGAVVALLLTPLIGQGGVGVAAGEQTKAFWFLSRAAGLVAYVLLWASVALGLLITSRTSRLWPGGPVAFDAHQFLSLLALALVTFHGLVLLGDAYIDFAPIHLIVPFSAVEYRPLWLGLGQTGSYLAAIVAFSFYARSWLGPRAWRLIHYASFAVYALVLAHAVGAGTDRASPPIFAMYVATGGAAYFLTVFRVFVSIRQSRTDTHEPSRA